MTENTPVPADEEPDDLVKVEVFDSLPPASADTFRKSMMTKSADDERLAVVLYSPDLQNVGSIDNSKTNATASYSRSVTEGFTLGTTVTFHAEASFEVGVEVVKAGLTVGWSISFTAQYNKSSTETIEFSVPGKSRAFLYQGYLRSRVLRHTPKDGRYAWVPGSEGRFLSNVIATSDVPRIEKGQLVTH